MECYTELKWVKREYSSRHSLNLISQNACQEDLSAGPKIQAKVRIFWRLRVKKGSTIHTPSNGEVLKERVNYTPSFEW